MRKSTLIIAAVVLACAGFAQAHTSEEEGASMGSAPITTPPLLVAANLPGMQPTRNPVQRLPGMSYAPALPSPLIMDLTNYPNPFDSRKAGIDGRTRIAYDLAQDAKVSVEIFDLLGNRVRGWDFQPGSNGARTGANTLDWDGTDASGRKVSKGGYIAQIVLETPETTVTAIRKIGVIH